MGRGDGYFHPVSDKKHLHIPKNHSAEIIPFFPWYIHDSSHEVLWYSPHFLAILKIPEKDLNSYPAFLQAKFAEPMRSKHNMFFFASPLNIAEQYKQIKNNPEDYRIKVPKDYQDKYFKALEKGEGFNVMDALEKAFVAEGLDKKEPELYKKIVKYKKILKSPKHRFSKKQIFIALIGIKVILTASYIIYKKNKKRAGIADPNAQKI